MAPDLPTFHSFNSTRVDTATYDARRQRIIVTFTDGVDWVYRNCSPRVWRDFTGAPSAGRYIHDVLDHHPNGAR